MCTCFLAFLLTAQSAQAYPPLQVLEKVVQDGTPEQSFQQASAREQSYEEHEFVERFNDLVKAMGVFSKKYKTSHAIDVKAVESIKKAYQKLEQADPWFKLGKAQQRR